MDGNSFDHWLEQYGKAWTARDAQAAAALYAPNATYQQTPLVEPLRGREAILEYWQGVCRTQREVHFSYEVLAFNGEAGLAHWHATFLRLPRGKRVLLDGIFLITLDAANQATSLREWWHRKDL